MAFTNGYLNRFMAITIANFSYLAIELQIFCFFILLFLFVKEVHKNLFKLHFYQSSFSH